MIPVLSWPRRSRVSNVVRVYNSYRLGRAWAAPVNSWAGLMQSLWSHPSFPMSGTALGAAVASASELLERATRRYPKPPFGLETTRIGGRTVAVREVPWLATPFCNLNRSGRPRARGVPTERAGAGGGLADERGARSGDTPLHDLDDGPHRYTHQSDASEPLRHQPFSRMVRAHRGAQGPRRRAWLFAPRLSGVPAAHRIRLDEPGASRRRAPAVLPRRSR